MRDAWEVAGSVEKAAMEQKILACGRCIWYSYSGRKKKLSASHLKAKVTGVNIQQILSCLISDADLAGSKLLYN